MKIFKRTTVAIFVLLLVAGTFCVSALSDETYSINLNKDYVTAKKGESLAKVSDTLGMKGKELADFMDENDVLFIAVDKENKIQIRLSKYKTEFSTLAGDVSSLDDNGFKELAESISSENASFTMDSSNQRKYIKSVRGLSDSGGRYISSQYVTVMDGYIYQLSVYEAWDDEDYERKAPKIFEGLVLYPQSDEHSVPLLVTIGFVLLVALFTAVFAVTLVGLIKNRKSKKIPENSKENDKTE